MYIDDASDSGELKVTVSGEEYTAEANYDLNGDGFDDSVVVDTDDGGHLIYTDTDADGVVDELSTFGTDDHADHAHFDSDRGAWISGEHDQPGRHEAPGGAPGAAASHADTVAVDSEHGELNLGTATVDTDHDGIFDTVVMPSGDATLMYTDVDGDGQADKLTQIDGNGNVEVREHSGEHEWTVTEQTNVASPGTSPHVESADDHAWNELFAHGTADPNGSADGVVRIDAVTGQWISPN